jgi:tRNA (guanine37-N1)-methyltransferase
MRVDVVTLFPDFVASVGRYGITGRALSAGILQVVTWNPRDYAVDPYRSVDDRPYGGGPGMVIKPGPLRAAIAAARQAAPQGTPVVYLSPQGRRMDQRQMARASQLPGLILVAGRYEGIDERVIELAVDEEWSVGDYVLSGGELPAMLIIDAVSRLLPGALGDAASAEQDSFVSGLLDHPHYTRPEEFEGLRVPEALLSGDHAAIARWRRRAALARTWRRRPDLLDGVTLDEADREYLRQLEVSKPSGTEPDGKPD